MGFFCILDVSAFRECRTAVKLFAGVIALFRSPQYQFGTAARTFSVRHCSRCGCRIWFGCGFRYRFRNRQCRRFFCRRYAFRCQSRNRNLRLSFRITDISAFRKCGTAVKLPSGVRARFGCPQYQCRTAGRAFHAMILLLYAVNMCLLHRFHRHSAKLTTYRKYFLYLLHQTHPGSASRLNGLWK